MSHMIEKSSEDILEHIMGTPNETLQQALYFDLL